MAAKKLKPGPEPSEWARESAERIVAEVDRIRGLLRVGDDEARVTEVLGTPEERCTSRDTGTEVLRCLRYATVALPEPEWLEDLGEEGLHAPTVSICFDFAPGATTTTWQGTVEVSFTQYDEPYALPFDEVHGVGEALRRLLEPRFGAAEVSGSFTKKLYALDYPSAHRHGLTRLFSRSGSIFGASVIELQASVAASEG